MRAVQAVSQVTDSANVRNYGRATALKMRIRGEAKDQWLVMRNTRFEPIRFAGYEDIGAFLLLAVLLGLILRLLVRFQFSRGPRWTA